MIDNIIIEKFCVIRGKKILFDYDKNIHLNDTKNSFDFFNYFKFLEDEKLRKMFEYLLEISKTSFVIILSINKNYKHILEFRAVSDRLDHNEITIKLNNVSKSTLQLLNY